MGKGILPEEILTRPKAWAERDSRAARLPDGAAWQEMEARLPWPVEMDAFVSRPKLRTVLGAAARNRVQDWENLRPFSLAVWMQNGRHANASTSQVVTRM